MHTHMCTHTFRKKIKLNFKVRVWFLFFKLWKVMLNSCLSTLKKKHQRTTRGGIRPSIGHRHQIRMDWSRTAVAPCYAKCWLLFCWIWGTSRSVSGESHGNWGQDDLKGTFGTVAICQLVQKYFPILTSSITIPDAYRLATSSRNNYYCEAGYSQSHHTNSSLTVNLKGRKRQRQFLLIYLGSPFSSVRHSLYKWRYNSLSLTM